MPHEPCTYDVLPNFRFAFHGQREDFPAWLLPIDEAGWRDYLAGRWDKMPPIEVHLFPRAAYSPEWFREWFGEWEGDAPEPYAFRAFFNPDTFRVVMLVDDTETPDSVVWLLIHELTHAALAHSRFLRFIFAHERDAMEITPEQEQRAGTDDDLHERLPEEVFCNRSARVQTGGLDLDRHWWRRRVAQRLTREAA